MPAVRWLKASTLSASPSSVDRKLGILKGYVLAQKGPFRSHGRGEFDDQALSTIISLGNKSAKGLKVRLGHPNGSSDSTAQFLGRTRNLTMGTATDARTGQRVSAVRGDLYFDKTALEEPIGGGKPKGVYIMDRVESDADSLSSSLVLEADEELRLEKDGTALKDDNGDPLPALWHPKRVHASDIVDTGDAVDGLLSAEELTKALSVGITPELSKVLRFDRVACLAGQLLDGMFHGSDRAVVEDRCRGWLSRYLDGRFGIDEPIEQPQLSQRALRLAQMAMRIAELKGAR